MKKLTHISICLLLAVLLTVTGCSFNPSSDFPQGTEGTQTETPSDTSEEKPDNTPSEDNPSTTPEKDDKPSGGDEEKPDNTPSEDNPSTTPEEDDKPSGGDEENPPISDTLRDPTDIEKRMLDVHYLAINECQNAWLAENVPWASSATKPEGASISYSYSSSERVYTLRLYIKNFKYQDKTDTLVITNGIIRAEFTLEEIIPAGFTPNDLFTSEDKWLAVDMYVDSHFTFNNSKEEYWTTGTKMTSENYIKEDFTLNGQRLNYTFEIDNTAPVPDPPEIVIEELV